MKFFDIDSGVKGLFVENNRFSTTHISVNLYLPLEKNKIAVNALLPYVLSSCSAKYPDFSSLNLKLADSYGAEIGGIADKIGDTQVLRFFSFSIDNEYIPEKIDLVAGCANLLFSMIFDPSVSKAAFMSADVEREKRLTIEKIEGMVNEKRSYAIGKTLSIMYEGEAFGELKCGSKEDVLKITPKSLYTAWREAISNAEIRILVIGKKVPENLFETFRCELSKFKRNYIPIAPSIPKKPSAKPTIISEEMDVAQGKMVLGFTTECVGNDKNTAFLSVFSDLFGGGPYSKLFTNVREKLSLCYYCAARANRTKGYLLVDCGIEPQNRQKAKDEILNQLEALKNGDFTEEELMASKRSIKDSLSCINDSEAALDGWYSAKLIGDPLTPEEFSVLIEAVTKEDIMTAASLYHLDTIYEIIPKESVER